MAAISYSLWYDPTGNGTHKQRQTLYATELVLTFSLKTFKLTSRFLKMPPCLASC